MFILLERFTASGFDDASIRGPYSVTPKLKMYMTIWYLSNTVTYRQLANLFGVSKAKAWMSVDNIINWIASIAEEYIHWPTADSIQSVNQKFEQKRRIPRVIGAIDCTHVTIKATTEYKTCYFDRNRNYSVILQAVVDADKKFTNIFCGEPGSLHDSRVLRRSKLFLEATQNKDNLFPNNTFLLGDSAYQNYSWLVTPFKDRGNLTELQHRFNFIHSSTRMVVENAFGLLKGRFRRLLHFTEHKDLERINKIIISACVLHNLCIQRYDLWNVCENAENTNQDVPSQFEEEEEIGGIDRRQQLFNELIQKHVL